MTKFRRGALYPFYHADELIGKDLIFTAAEMEKISDSFKSMCEAQDIIHKRYTDSEKSWKDEADILRGKPWQ